MLLILIAFVIGCLALNIYGVCALKKCDKNVKYVQQQSHRVIGKVQLVRKIHEIGAFLGFGFFVTLSVIFMWFWALEAQVSDVIGYGITTGLVIDDILLGVFFIWSTNTYQKIGEL